MVTWLSVTVSVTVSMTVFAVAQPGGGSKGSADPFKISGGARSGFGGACSCLGGARSSLGGARSSFGGALSGFRGARSGFAGARSGVLGVRSGFGGARSQSSDPSEMKSWLRHCVFVTVCECVSDCRGVIFLKWLWVLDCRGAAVRGHQGSYCE